MHFNFILLYPRALGVMYIENKLISSTNFQDAIFDIDNICDLQIYLDAIFEIDSIQDSQMCYIYF